MRVLGIETSSRRGSVALVEDGHVVARASHAELNAHAERLGSLLEAVLAEAGWDKSTLERVAVGVGPGSFTGLRVGIAFAQGIALGLGLELSGLGSLRAMADACPAEVTGVRLALLDARRGEVFAAAYDESGRERLAPLALARETALRTLLERLGPEVVLLGEVVAELGPGPEARVHRSDSTDLPDATAVARLALEASANASFIEPLYVRDAGATPQALVPSPFRRD
jgi:tRNA threonylcarbamoyladenosine biosynthesis protein TsaB